MIVRGLVEPDGTTILPAEVREALGVGAGDLVAF